MERGWYWKVHGSEYARFKVGELPKFVGWPTLLSLIEECENTPYYEESVFLGLSPFEREKLRQRLIMRDKALIAIAFETGGRIGEVLQLRKPMFTVLEDRIVIKDMPVIKRWEKIGEQIEVWQEKDPPQDTKRWHWSYKYDAWVRRKFVTKPKLDRRNVLEIPRFEPLTQYIVEWLDMVEDWLFPAYGVKGNKPISPTRAYQIVTSIGSRIGLKICNHWFRSQRASQLAEEYGWREFELKRFFSWKSDKEAVLYAKLSPTKLFEMMKPIKIGEVS